MQTTAYKPSTMKTVTPARTLIAALILAAASTAQAKLEVYQIDPAHSSITFKIRHFVGKVAGSFDTFSGELRLNREDMARSKATATIETASIDTGNDKRDGHLRSPDYFNAGEYPEITFESSSWTPVEGKEDTWEISGLLTMHGKTIPVSFQAELLGFGTGREGTPLVGFEGTGELDRAVWGIDAGTPAVGLEVDYTINIEAQRTETTKG